MKPVLTFFFLIASIEVHAQVSFELIWENEKAVALELKGMSETDLSIRLEGNEVALLGESEKIDSGVIFQPLWPFSEGMTYEILNGDVVLANFTIPITKKADIEILGVYPSADTIPENNLKIYIEFSQPMSQGKALRNVKLFDLKEGNERDVFLDLRPELWNEEGTILTLWLDPGRIKRDLGPNQLLGTPLVAGNRYQLEVSDSWKSVNGSKLKHVYTKIFYTRNADRNNPSVHKWELSVPKLGSTRPLVINFHESLDYLLSIETIDVYVADEKIRGRIEIEDNQSLWKFYPTEDWFSGTYNLRIESRLEDLAGNNLNRLFDRDLNKGDNVEEQKFHILEFRIE